MPAALFSHETPIQTDCAPDPDGNLDCGQTTASWHLPRVVSSGPTKEIPMRGLALGITVLVLLTSVAAAQAAATKRHSRAHPVARVSADSAQVVALTEVPGAHVRSRELEREHGRLVYSFDLTLPGRTGIEEVQVDAITGLVVSHKHETPAAEQKEQRQEARKRNRSSSSKS
jgi:hypothetical protein